MGIEKTKLTAGSIIVITIASSAPNPATRQNAAEGCHYYSEHLHTPFFRFKFLNTGPFFFRTNTHERNCKLILCEELGRIVPF